MTPPRAIKYNRERGSDEYAGYEEKFDGLIRLCREVPLAVPPIEFVWVATPSVLGDSYEELVESLSMIADAGLHLIVAGAEGVPEQPPAPAIVLATSGGVVVPP